MIYTVTLNPAIDYVVHTDEIVIGSINRSKFEDIYFGGKGINVSIVLSELGMKSKAWGFTAGFTGKAIEEGVRKKGIETDFVYLENGCSRINVKIKSGEETELNGSGPVIPEEAVQLFFEKLNLLKDGDALILSGSIPKSIPSDIYEKILDYIADKKIRTVVDASKELLLNTLKYKPFLVKPNHYELGEIFDAVISTEDDVIKYAGKLKEMGARNVLVSMAGEGALLLDENGNVHRCGACKGIVKNSVGAGDSMVAGFIAGLEQGDYEYALKLGTAAGGATAFSDGLAKKDNIFKLLDELL